MTEVLPHRLSDDLCRLPTYPNARGYDEMVVMRDVVVRSWNERMLPVAVTHVAYVPSEHIAGLSTITSLLEHVARDARTLESLCNRAAGALAELLSPRGVAVVVEVEAGHLLRPPRDGDVQTVATVMTTTGVIRDDPHLRSELFRLLRPRRSRSSRPHA